MLCLIKYGISSPFGYGISPASLTSRIVFHFSCSILSVCLLICLNLMAGFHLSGLTKYVPQYVTENMENYGATFIKTLYYHFYQLGAHEACAYLVLRLLYNFCV